MTDKTYVEQLNNTTIMMVKTIAFYLTKKANQIEHRDEEDKPGDRTLMEYSASFDNFRNGTLEMSLMVPEKTRKDAMLECVSLIIETKPENTSKNEIAIKSIDDGITGTPELFHIIHAGSRIIDYSAFQSTNDYCNAFKNQINENYKTLIRDIILYLTMDVPKGEMDAPKEEPKDVPEEPTAAQEEPNDAPE